MLIAFVSLVAMFNYLLGFWNTSLQEIMGLFFKPLAWTMGVPWSKAEIMGTLMGEKLALTELIAYGDLRTLIANGEISNRTAIIASYALCGFANFASIGIQLGGIGSIAPERRKDLSKLVFKAMLGGALASWLTASIAGIMIPLQKIGDINYDDYISQYDIGRIEKHINEEKELLDWQVYYADFNQDGCINLADISEIKASNKFIGPKLTDPILEGSFKLSKNYEKFKILIQLGINTVKNSRKIKDDSIDECSVDLLNQRNP